MSHPDRRPLCSHYTDCLTNAAELDAPSTGCAHCTRFRRASDAALRAEIPGLIDLAMLLECARFYGVDDKMVASCIRPDPAVEVEPQPRPRRPDRWELRRARSLSTTMAIVARSKRRRAERRVLIAERARLMARQARQERDSEVFTSGRCQPPVRDESAAAGH